MFASPVYASAIPDAVEQRARTVIETDRATCRMTEAVTVVVHDGTLSEPTQVDGEIANSPATQAPTPAPSQEQALVPAPALPPGTTTPCRIVEDSGTNRKPHNSRRGKQYKCGSCSELGHNTKTCPRRPPTVPLPPTIPATTVTLAPAPSPPAASLVPANGDENTASLGAIQPVLTDDEFVSLGNAMGRTPYGVSGAVASRTSPIPAGAPVGTLGRVQPLRLESAMEAGNRRVLAAEAALAGAESGAEFEEAIAALDAAVTNLERIASLARRCALVAYTLNAPAEQGEQSEVKRMRLEAMGTNSQDDGR